MDNFTALPGNGLTAEYENAVLSGGNYKFISTRTDISQEMQEQSQKLANAIGNIVIIDESQKLILDKKEREKQMKCDMKEKEKISNFCSERCEDGRKKEV